ncbi:MAG: SCO family protein [Flammeovirgaceae bacterium]|nr:SCO family protein [Flammeovirgaceae bacterium]MBE62826.1 SCO family protein [Flammeovirgaceae bacterium]MBR08678.1 SCO family protein [Rickettsiales bacterium]HCX25117.1 SCO family protein [Cytophagales bacterium]|tara:strand:+ start:773 stop:1417 length:645 start_codon:yes stop_codon:yes gene_type:complete
MKSSILHLLAFSALLMSCNDSKTSSSRVDELPYFDEATFTPKWSDSFEITSTFHQIPPFSLIDQSGDTITDQNLSGKVTVVNFFFTSCPGICPKMTDNMKLVQEAFEQENNLQIYSHSVTPDYDSVSVLKKYAERQGISSKKWHLLTGEQTMIYDLGRNQYFIEEDLGLDKDPEDFIHTENFVLIDQNKRIRGIYNGLNKSSVNQLIADAKTLL